MMSRPIPDRYLVPVLVVIVGVAALLPLGRMDAISAGLLANAGAYDLQAIGQLLLAVGVIGLGISLKQLPGTSGVLMAVGGILLGWILLQRVWSGLHFTGAIGLWLLLAVIVVDLWLAMSKLAARSHVVARLIVPLLFGGVLIYLWEVLAVGFDVPQVLLPSPSEIARVVGANTDILWIDFHQTFIKAVIPGYFMGCAIGFLVAVAIDRSDFLQRGLLPIGGAISAMPIVGIAPIMVMWFGFDWHSKAAVVVIMTFFPMMVNTLAGLQYAGAMERELMRSYAATYRQELIKLRLPGALPFVFNALKLNSTLALIGAIVAEFFGTPIQGMGFRISTEVASMDIDMVWATIVVAAAAGSISYGLLALLERAVTFWHPSMRGAG
ncbi:MAG: ABC transporter permease [Pseudomonadota bacterium]